LSVAREARRPETLCLGVPLCSFRVDDRTDASGDRIRFHFLLVELGAKHGVNCSLIQNQSPGKMKKAGKPDLLISASKASASTSVVKGLERNSLRSDEVFSRALAVAIVLHNVETELLAFNEALHSCTLDCRDMHEHVWLSAVLFDEAKTLCGIEELNRSIAHSDSLSNRHRNSPLARMTNAARHEFERENRKNAAAR
jgi:hypothetical protein